MLINEDEARTFLARALPWPDDPNAPGYVDLIWCEPRRDDPKKKWWTGRAARTPQQLTGFLTNWAREDVPRDFYVCMSRQRDATEKISKKGFKYLKAERSSGGALGLKALYLDLDYKRYGSQKAAEKAFVEFAAAIGLPKPSVIVETGGGKHIYWTLDRILLPQEWLPLAHGLTGAALKQGLKFDTNCTVDLARILRVPGTLNFKPDYPEPRPVQLRFCATFDYPVERFSMLTQYAGAIPAVSNVVPFPNLGRSPIPLTEPNTLAAGIETMAPLPAREVFRGCGFLREAFLTGGASLPEPLWRHTLRAAMFMQSPQALAHELSKGHAGYDFEATERKLAEQKKAHGFPQCDAIEKEFASAALVSPCTTCPHRGKIKSPLNLALQHTPAVVVAVAELTAEIKLPDVCTRLPEGYQRAPDGRVFARVPVPVASGGEDKGEEVEVYLSDNPILGAMVSQEGDDWTLHLICILDRVRTIHIPTDKTSSPKDLQKHMHGKGFIVNDEGRMKRFLMAWFQTLQKSKEAMLNPQPFGWAHDAGKVSGFAYGGRIWSAGEPQQAAAPDPQLGVQFSPTGEDAPWLEAAAMIAAERRPALDAIVASAFAAPLMTFANHAGAALCAYSPHSGIGKTTAMKVAVSVWGHPVKGMMVLDDSTNSLSKKLAALNSLPLCWDELQTKDSTRSFHAVLMRLSSGREKARLSRDAKFQDTPEWRSLLVSASNMSVLASVTRNATTPAALMRIFEYEVPPPIEGGPGRLPSEADAGEKLAALDHNYGRVGLAYARWLGRNIDQVRLDMRKRLRFVEQIMRAQTDERFWVALCAALIQGAIYANQLHLVAIDVMELVRFLQGVFSGMRQQRTDRATDLHSPAALIRWLDRYINDMRHRDQLLKTTRVHTAHGRRRIEDAIKIISPETHRITHSNFNIQLGVEDGILLMPEWHFEEWCYRQDNDAGVAHALKDALMKLHCAEVGRWRIGAYTEIRGLAADHQRTPPNALRVDLRRLSAMIELPASLEADAS